jgi:hypothetical protein
VTNHYYKYYWGQTEDQTQPREQELVIAAPNWRTAHQRFRRVVWSLIRDRGQCWVTDRVHCHRTDRSGSETRGSEGFIMHFDRWLNKENHNG